MRDKRQSFKPENQPIPTTDKGISQAELCRRFGIESKSVKRVAERQGQTVQAYLQNRTGWTARQVETQIKWFPPDQQG